MVKRIVRGNGKLLNKVNDLAQLPKVNLLGISQ